MRKKRIMIIGPGGSGKTSLANAINGTGGPLRKTQDTIYGKHTLDVPGSYLENPWMYMHMISLAQDASHLLILVDQSRCIDKYSPNLALAFRIPVIGVITKCDLNPENEEKCRALLKKVGVEEPYFKVSIPKGIGIKELKAFLFKEN